MLTLQYRPALGYMCFMILLLEPATDLCARRGGFQVSKVRIQPIAARVAFSRRQDLDLLAAREDLCKRDHNPINLGTTAPVTHVGMNCISKVQRRGIGREVYYMTLRSEHVYPIVESRLLEVVDEIGATRRPLRAFEKSA